MSIITYPLTLDTKRDFHQVLVMKEGDAGSRRIQITVTEDGKLVDISDFHAMIKWKKPDGTIVEKTCTASENHSVSFTCTEQMLLVPGIAKAELCLYTLENVLLSTMPFSISIKNATVRNSDIESSNEFNTLVETLQQAQENYYYVIEQATAQANQAKEKATQASSFASTATNAANRASTFATNANNYANAASSSAQQANNFSTESKSYAIGSTGTRENEDTDNAKYYCEQAHFISQAMQGFLLPMGTIEYPQLETATKRAGYMYTISHSFVTDNTFKGGSGVTYPGGTIIYRTEYGFWDFLEGTVTGVKGNAETSYRKGTINLTPENIGALPSNGTAVKANALNNTSMIGSSNKPVYFNSSGKPVAFSSTIGSESTPVYLKNGAITACSSVSQGNNEIIIAQGAFRLGSGRSCSFTIPEKGLHTLTDLSNTTGWYQNICCSGGMEASPASYNGTYAILRIAGIVSSHETFVEENYLLVRNDLNLCSSIYDASCKLYPRYDNSVNTENYLTLTLSSNGTLSIQDFGGSIIIHSIVAL